MSAARGRILIVDDEEDIRETLADRLEAEGYEVVTAVNGVEALQHIRSAELDLVLLDLQMPQMDGMEVLQQLAAESLDPTVVVITAYGTIERAVQAIKAGAYDFIPKPFEPDHIRAVVEKAMEREGLRRENAYWRQQASSSTSPLTTEAPKMRQVFDTAYRAADSDATVLILGESGTGKEVLARAIHHRSGRRDKPFVAVNCVALAENLLESELFGHEKGAFTGAQQQKKGCFEMARGGTVLLDEIGSTRPDFQVKLLRVLQEGTFQRVGSGQELHADVRVIAATNRDLEKAMQEGSFLPDLYYRLNVVALRVPPLRERIEDLAALAQLFLQKYAHETKREVVGIADETLACMQAYAWPGNVRELENAIERAVVLGTEEQIEPEDLPEQILGAAAVAQEEMTAGYHASVKDYQRRLIQKTLEQTEGHQARAAEILGLQRTYLSRLIKNLGLR